MVAFLGGQALELGMAYSKTDKGSVAFKERSEALSNRQRSLFLLFDGVKTVEQVLSITKPLNITQADIDHLIACEFIRDADPIGTALVAKPPATELSAVAAAPVTSGTPIAPVSSVVVSSKSHQERFAEAWPLATQLTAGMGLRGFRLNLSIEAASGYDDLLALFPKIQAAVGAEKCKALEKALKF